MERSSLRTCARTSGFARPSVSGFGGATMATAARTGRYAYVFGGLRSNGVSAEITRLRTDSTIAETSAVSLSSHFALTTSAVVGNAAYIFEGWTGYSDQNRIEVFRSVDNPSPILWIGIASVLVAAVAIGGLAVFLRGRKRRSAPLGGLTPPT